MKFQTFSGTDDAGRRSDHGDGVRGSTASDGSRRDAGGVADYESLTRAINDIEADIEDRNNRIAQIEVRLCQLNRIVAGRISGGRRIPNGDYQALCEEQASLKAECMQIRSEAGELRVRRSRLCRDREQCVPTDRPDAPARTNHLLTLILAELRKLTAKPGGD
jgi:hypothetical protein